MAIRVVAVSAPDLPEGRIGQRSLTSYDPVSLFNACSEAALLADTGSGAWGESNWSVSRNSRRQYLMLMRSLRQDESTFSELLLREKPNLLLIGAMTLCFPGAIACARIARDILGDKVCIVLGGRHASETIYWDNASQRVVHHPGSPLRLMAERRIGHVFDIVVAGEGGQVISRIGEVVARLERSGMSPRGAWRELAGWLTVPGNWIAGAVESDHIEVVKSKGIDQQPVLLPAVCELFGVETSFDIFDGRITAQVFSGPGNGCVHDCSFCSERNSVTGPITQRGLAPDYLYHQLVGASKVITSDHPGKKASAFVEDSIMMGGSFQSMLKLGSLLNRSGIDIRFGGQLTIDQVLSKIEILRVLKSVGLDYLFVGIETLSPHAVGGMHKDISRNGMDWMSRTEKMLNVLDALGIKCGVSLLFGIGEEHSDRLRLISRIADWQRSLDSPKVVSANWAVQHPLKGDDGGSNFRYDEWGTPEGSFLEAFRDFGEASVLYPIAGQKRPKLEEVLEVSHAISQLAIYPLNNRKVQNYVDHQHLRRTPSVRS
ncbi:MAG: B12-binding domain/radical SAM domain-containing protein [Bacteroidetes bacterium]|nr:B12-binding domain/radical SAM domain-containing protein [Bacteroidota bacterium]